MKQQTRSKQLLAIAAVIVAAIFWGCLGLFSRRLTDAGLDAMDKALVRMTVGLTGMGVYLLALHRDKFRVRLRDLWCFFGSGVVSLLFFMWCYFQCMQLTSLAVAGILLYTAPIFVMLLSALFFKEKLTKRKLIALCLAFGGCILVSGTGGGQSLTTRALVFGLGSGLGYGLYSIFSRFAVDRGYDSTTITFYTFVFCVLFCLPLADIPRIVSAAAADHSLILWYVLMGLLTGLASYQLYTWALQYLEASRASIIASLEPVVAAAAGVIVYQETLSLPGLLGICLVLCAIVLLSLKTKKVNNP